MCVVRGLFQNEKPMIIIIAEDVTNGQKTPVEAGKVENGQEDTSKNAIGDGAEQDDENQDGAAAVTKVST